MFFRHRKRVHDVDDWTNSEDPETEAQSEAAVAIQRIWRGGKDRGKIQRLKIRKRPFGYYTHSLGLTYLSTSPNDQHRLAKPSRKSQLFMLLEDPSSSQMAQAISFVFISTIAISVLGFVLETEPDVYETYSEALQLLEIFCTVVFSLEYVLRLAVCDQGGHSVQQFVCSPMNILDLIAIIPFYVEWGLQEAGFSDTPVLRAFRVVRLIRVVRVLKLGRYASGVRLTAQALAASSQALSVLFFLLSIGVVLFSSALYYAEKLSCPERDNMSAADLATYASDCADTFNRGISPTFGLCCTIHDAPEDFPSIIATFWWSMVTMTSVGYGEVYPKTALGKCVGCFVMLVGMVVIALPAAIVGQKFSELYENHNMDMARAAASTRMRVPGRTWALVPGSDILNRLSRVRVRDPDMTEALSSFVRSLPEVWEQRELLMRERRYVFHKQSETNITLGKLLRQMEVGR